MLFLFVFLLSLSLAGVIADCIAPRHPNMEDLIDKVLDRFM